MNDLFDQITLPFLIALGVCLAICLVVFQYWDCPGFFRQAFRLNNRGKTLLFLFLFGTILAVLAMVLCAYMRLTDEATQIITGVIVGFTCALIPGLFKSREDARRSRAAATSNRDKGAKRRKG